MAEFQGRIDLTGQRFERLTVVNEPPESRAGVLYWLVACDCGIRLYVSGHRLRSGRSRSCGCFQRELCGSRKVQMIGQRFHMLTVIGPSRTNPDGRGIQWKVRCDCGTEKYVSRHALLHGTKSCGCNRSAAIRRAAQTHAMSKTAIYHIWGGMHARCYDPQSDAFRYYGARGIAVCERWHRFENFYADMGDRPEGKSLDRWPDQNGNYAPDNCRWATQTEQNRNRRDNRELTHDGRTQCLTAWAKELGISFSTLWNRLNYGWSVEKALSTPTRTRNLYPEKK